MKKILGLITVLVAFSCAPKKEEGFKVSGTLKGFEDGETVYINQVSNSGRMVPVDSTSIKEGKFEISLPKVESSDYSVITFSDTRGNILLLSENEAITVEAEKGKLQERKLSGGKVNAIFSTFYDRVIELANQQRELSEQNQKARVEGDYQEQVRLSKVNDSLQKAQKELRLEYVKKDPQSLVNIMAIAELMNMQEKPKTLYGYFKELTPQLKESRLGKLIQENLEESLATTNEVGDEVEDFSAPSPEGTPLSLKKNLGKVTLLDFWASWCKPCRYENPNVVRVYNKYHDKGLEIISISLDRDKNKWLKAIETDQMAWKHISNLKFWQEPIAKRFGVRSIPATFLLDENGVIIAKNLRGQALEDKISEVLQ